jgi:hypothetical protein
MEMVELRLFSLGAPPGGHSLLVGSNYSPFFTPGILAPQLPVPQIPVLSHPWLTVEAANFSSSSMSYRLYL